MMYYHDILRQLSGIYGQGEARAILRIVLEEHFHLNRNDILCNDFSGLDGRKAEEFEVIFSRLKRSEPVQYILKEAQFCGNSFTVGPSVLVPRPETEDLVDCILAHTVSEESGKRQPSARSCAELRVLDIGTGSGCIGITLAIHRPEWRVAGLDFNPEALDIARNNAAKLGAKNIDFIEKDILKAAGEDADTWDVIVSNPPYVTEKERCGMPDNVLLYEPPSALFVPGDRPLLFYSAILAYAGDALRHGGQLFFEVNSSYAADVKALMERENYKNLHIETDRYGRERIVFGIRE